MKLKTLARFDGEKQFLLGALGAVILTIGIVALFGVYNLLRCCGWKEVLMWASIITFVLVSSWNIGFLIHMMRSDNSKFYCPCGYNCRHFIFEWYHRFKCLSFVLNGED